MSRLSQTYSFRSTLRLLARHLSYLDFRLAVFFDSCQRSRNVKNPVRLVVVFFRWCILRSMKMPNTAWIPVANARTLRSPTLGRVPRKDWHCPRAGLVVLPRFYLCLRQGADRRFPANANRWDSSDQSPGNAAALPVISLCHNVFVGRHSLDLERFLFPLSKWTG